MDRYHRDHSSGGEDGLEEMDETEETEFLADTGLGDTTQKVSQEEANWRDKPVDDKCEEMMEQLATGRRRWKDGQGENPGIPALEDFKIKSLDERDPRNEHRPTFLHALATRWKEYKTQHVAVRQAILYIIQNAPIETARKGRYGEAPIWHEAASYGNMDFLNFIKENFRDRLLPILMMPDALGRNFFHDIFLAPVSTSSDKEPTRKRTLIRANQYLAIASQESLAAQDDLGNTPVHYAMHSAQCRGRGEEYIKHVKNMILRADSLMKHGTDFNNFDQSPYQFCVQSKTTKRKTAAGQSFTSGREKSDKTTKMSFLDVAKSKVIGSADMSASLENEIQDRVASYPHPPNLDCGRPRPGFDAWHGDRAPSLNRLNLPGNQGLRRSYTHNLPPQSTTQLASSYRQTGRTKEVSEKERDKETHPDKSMERLLSFLHLHYIKERDDLVARELIYGRHANEINLYFDAAGQKSKSARAVAELVDRLAIGGFDKTLSYVHIPILVNEDAEETPPMGPKRYTSRHTTSSTTAVPRNPRLGRRSLVSVFDKLYYAGVRQILYLDVEDKAAPHTDEAIERALAGYDWLGPTKSSRGERITVETWNWRKIDLSIDVICHAAPEVRHLHLYWSGNQAVLRGWASKDGIPRLCSRTRGKGLQTVDIHATPGLESVERMRRSLNIFKNSLKQNIELEEMPEIYQHESINNPLNPPTAGPHEHSTTRNQGAETADRHLWMDRMSQFRGALQQVYEQLTEEGQRRGRVKVALIDDGVDVASLPVFFGQMVEAYGVSYCPRGEERENPWHLSTNGHGTIMANMITQLNPWVSLCVMRVQDGTSGGGTRTISARGAAMAIRSAIGRKVDIISLSWTILAKGRTSRPHADGPQRPVNKDIEELGKAIDEAVKARILIFCSASDDIETSALDTLPYQQAPDYIFRIGAASRHGQRDPSSEDAQRINFYFPGNMVEEAVDPTTSTQARLHTGASVSTALATGLASLIIYCAVIVRNHHESEGLVSSEFARKADGLKERDQLDAAFKSITFPGWQDAKFLPIWDFFRSTSSRINTESGKAKFKALSELVRKVSKNIF